MHRTQILHGIKGIFPIIKKECPQAIHYPSRYSGLKGYRLAIDATLLVQRFHFSDEEIPYRHVIGFYRLIRSLRASDVYPIFVFDHLSSRLKAKSRETEKRREARGIMRERMKVENRRAWRLKTLNELLNNILALSQEERLQVGRLLKGWSRSHAVEGSQADNEHRAKEIEEFLATVADDSLESSDSIRDWSAFRSLAEEVTTADDAQAPSLAEDDEQGVGISSEDTVEQPEEEPSVGSEDFNSSWKTIYEEQTSPVYAIAVQIDALWRDFKEHHLQAEIRERKEQAVARTRTAEDVDTSNTEGVTPVLPTTSMNATSPETTPPTSIPAAAPSDPPTPPPPTAAQREMNLIEEQLYISFMGGLDAQTTSVPKADDATWKAVQEKMDSSIQIAAKEVDRVSDQPEEPLVPSAETPTAPPSPTRMEVDQTAFEAITARNESLARSYKKSTAPLAPSIFDDCAQLCALMQAPVLWTGSGSPHGGERGEAEALAASLVAAGYADAVATEDSDVLLAEVPLLRHLTGTKKPLELVDSQAVRRTLFPPAPAASASSSSAAAQAIDAATAADEALKDAVSRNDALSRYSMLELALLCGTDFNRTIPGLGAKGALRLLQKYGTLRGILKSHPPASKKYHPPDGLSWREYGGELTRARMIFKTPPDAHRAMRLNGLRSWDGTGEQRRRRRSRSSSKGRTAAATAVDVASDASSSTQSTFEGLSDASQARNALDSPDEPLPAESGAELTAEEQIASSDPGEPPSLMAMAEDIPSEDNATTLKADEAKSQIMRIPPPPPKSLLLALAEEPGRQNKDDEAYREFFPSQRHFEVPDYDQFAVQAFLRSKGVDEGRGAESGLESSTSWREREDALQSGLATLEDEDDERVGRGQTSSNAPSLGKNGFGDTMFGDGGGSIRFAWDGAGEIAEERQDDPGEGEEKR